MFFVLKSSRDFFWRTEENPKGPADDVDQNCRIIIVFLTFAMDLYLNRVILALNV